jgi:RluA family pseudouridine synthase
LKISTIDFQTAIHNAVLQLKNPPSKPRLFSLSVKKKYNGFTILDLYVNSFPHVRSDFWNDKIKSGNLTVDNQVVAINYQLKAGQITQHSVPPKQEPSINTNIELVDCTDDYWVINKPSPLPIHAGGRYQNHTLTELLKKAFPQLSIHIINRLDANTTGLVLIALNKNSAQDFNLQFKNRKVTKTYLALVEGIPLQSKFSSNKSISTEKTAAGGREIGVGKASLTTFELQSKFKDLTLLKVTPSSGRTNQIRLHLSNEGLPIKGDLGYKNPEYFKNHPLTYPTDSLFLHSWKLRFIYKGKETIHIAPPNEKWLEYLT